MQEIVSERNFLKSLINYIPLLLALAYCLGTIKIYVFYQWFGFNILPFLDISDLLTQTFNDLVYLLEGSILITTIVSLYLLINPKVLEIDDKKLEASTEVKDQVYEDSKFKWTFTILVLLSEVSYIYANYKQYFTQSNFRVTIICIVTALLLGTIAFIAGRSHSSNYQYKKEFYIFTSLLIVYIFCVQSLKAGYFTENQTVGTTIYTNSEIIKTSSELKYLGTTSKYLFLYRKPTKAIEVYPMSDIKKLVIRN